MLDHRRVKFRGATFLAKISDTISGRRRSRFEALSWGSCSIPGPECFPYQTYWYVYNEFFSNITLTCSKTHTGFSSSFSIKSMSRNHETEQPANTCNYIYNSCFPSCKCWWISIISTYSIYSGYPPLYIYPPYILYIYYIYIPNIDSTSIIPFFLLIPRCQHPKKTPPGGQFFMACVPWYHAQSRHICDGKAGAPGIPGIPGSPGIPGI